MITVSRKDTGIELVCQTLAEATDVYNYLVNYSYLVNSSLLPVTLLPTSLVDKTAKDVAPNVRKLWHSTMSGKYDLSILHILAQEIGSRLSPNNVVVKAGSPPKARYYHWVNFLSRLRAFCKESNWNMDNILILEGTNHRPIWSAEAGSLNLYHKVK